MTREEAIKWFEREKEAAERQVVAFESCFKCFKSAHRKIVAYNDMAISALREQSVADTNVGNKSDPCPWCKRGWDWDVIDGDFGQYVHHSMIKHCFHCGRRLEEV